MNQRKSRRKSGAFLALSLTAAVALSACAGADRSAGGAAQSEAIRDQADTVLRLARASRQAGDYASAINLYRSAVAAKPEDAALKIELGETLLDAGFADDATDVFGKVDTKSSSHISALVGLARAYLNLGEPAKALEQARNAQASAPGDRRAGIAQGVALDMLGRHDEAQKAYRAVLAAAPRNVSARNDLALSLAMTRKFPEAIELMTALVKSAEATPRIRQNLALIYGLMGKDDEAAAVSRADLDAATTAANLRFFDYLREEKREH